MRMTEQTQNVVRAAGARTGACCACAPLPLAPRVLLTYVHMPVHLLHPYHFRRLCLVLLVFL